MRNFDRKALAKVALALAFGLFGLVPASAQTTLRIFVGGQHPEIMRPLVERYMSENPDVRVEVETGGASADRQHRYLNAVFATRDATLDLMLVDVIRPAQLATAQWIEPLDAYLGAEKDAIMARYLPAYRAASTFNGKVVALPFQADALFLYYRKDLLAKYGLQPPATWDALKAAALTVLDGEKTPGLVGFKAAGAPVESAVCSYLVPMWGSGEDLLKNGKLNLSGEAAKQPFRLWGELKAANVMPLNPAEVATDQIRQTFQSGKLVFGMTWGYAWNRMQNDPDSAVRDKFAVVPLPGFTADRQVSCLGGWQIALSSFSPNKAQAAKLARFLSSPEISRSLTVTAAQLPVFTSLYSDAEVVAANPWFAEALPALLAARIRPQTPRYPEISEVIRSSLHAFLAGTKTAEAAMMDMTARLEAIFR